MKLALILFLLFCTAVLCDEVSCLVRLYLKIYRNLITRYCYRIPHVVIQLTDTRDTMKKQPW